MAGTTLQTTTLIDGPSPYLAMLATLSEYTRPDRKRLYLHGSKAEPAMNEIRSDDVADTRLNDFPAVEALAFVVDALREWLKYRPTEMDGDTNPYRNWKRFNRGGRQ